MRALVIDDDPVTLLYLKGVLSPHAEVHQASAGQEGVEAFAAALAGGQPFDAVLVDIRMPGMDGHQALQKIRSLEAEAGIYGEDEAAVFMVSSASDAKNVNRAFFQGRAVSFLPKPVAPGQLLEELRKFGLLE
jgi:two-component system chemotaxis response regulator CheY